MSILSPFHIFHRWCISIRSKILCDNKKCLCLMNTLSDYYYSAKNMHRLVFKCKRNTTKQHEAQRRRRKKKWKKTYSNIW